MIFEKNITKTYWTELLHQISIGHLRKKNNKNLINNPVAKSMFERTQKLSRKLNPPLHPIMLIETSMKFA